MKLHEILKTGDYIKHKRFHYRYKISKLNTNGAKFIKVIDITDDCSRGFISIVDLDEYYIMDTYSLLKKL
jgi:hypothetical protein